MRGSASCLTSGLESRASEGQRCRTASGARTLLVLGSGSACHRETLAQVRARYLCTGLGETARDEAVAGG
jgi:hypothetical protein